jgi:biopolymer transport protein ExbB
MKSLATYVHMTLTLAVFSVNIGLLSPAHAQNSASGSLGGPAAASQAPQSASALPAATATLPAQAASPAKAANPYGLAAIWTQGDWVAKLSLLLLATMSIASWVVITQKILELKKLKAHTADAQKVFASPAGLNNAIAALPAQNPLRFVGLSALESARQFPALQGRVDYDRWLVRGIESAMARLHIQSQEGLSMLATIGSTAPFVGLFGTVWAVYNALVKIGASGQASIDKVAGPVGEALIMTAIGLAVAVPAVFGYNWLIRRNKLALESVRQFGATLHLHLLAQPAATATLAQPAAANTSAQPAP